jgi:beta-aspartyl-peptidase (threonine type)
MASLRNKKFSLIVHGGAWDIPKKFHQAHLSGMERAAGLGFDLLKGGARATDTVIEMVKILEENPAFDAGRGSFLNKAGEAEMDALIMDGSDLSVGAVAAIQNVWHPILAAELVRTVSEHTLLVGHGATQFAHQHGLPFCPTEKLLVGRELKRYQELKKKKNFRTRNYFEFSLPGRDTVGAVARDQYGNLAVATSTGGTPHKLPGRVGDTPLVGAGAYADNRCGAAASTGWGESIMKILLAKTAVDAMQKRTVRQAARRAVSLLGKKVDGLGGIICINPEGQAAFAYNTPYMARAIADQTGLCHVGI